jgi:cytochrome c oxidase subunit IV
MSENSEHIVPVKVYLAVFAALMVGTAVTTAAAFIDLGVFNGIVALTIAMTKAVLVVLFFMHVKYESKMTKVTIISAIAFLCILLALTMTDYISRPWSGRPGAAFANQQ